ncbi:MAG TPA: hypothetical protein VH092_36520, partial [Urbifossiella sp.]|nr:hypothetical protein [Urbifossiella sp.]
IVSTSDPIPSGDTIQPPHKQAAKYYREVADDKGGEFRVTMEHPKESEPKPMVIEITASGAEVQKKLSAGAAAAVAVSAPRAG